MTDCDKALLVQAEFDGELDAAEAAAMIAHRAACPICARGWQTLAATRDALRTQAPYHRASPALRRAVERRFAASAAPARSRLPWWREAASFALGAVAAAVFVLSLAPAGEPGLLAAVVDDHVRALQPGHLTDVISSDRHTVKPWYDGRLDFAPPVKDPVGQGFTLIGGRLDYLAGRPVAALAYARGKHPIDLFVWPAAPGDSAPASAQRQGYNVIHWTEGGMTLWAVSDLERDQLEEFVREWRRTP